MSGDNYAGVMRDKNNLLTSKVVIGSTWFAELDNDSRAANAIHEALHVHFKTGDEQLKSWLQNLGFKPGYGNNPIGSHDITAWIKDGCK